jgi:hypothetical protein
VASCDPRCALDFLLVLPLEGFPVDSARGVDKRLKQGRIGNCARYLSTSLDLLARRGEFVYPGECDLPVWQFPTAISQFFS